MPPIPAALTRELGVMATADAFTGDPYEETPELQWPNSLGIYDRMERTDGQTQSVLSAVTGPILSARFNLTGRRVRPPVLEACTAELGLSEDEDGRRRPRDNGVSWDDFLRHALLMFVYGYMPFVPKYEIGPPEIRDAKAPEMMGHLRKLAPRMPRSITQIDVAPDGGLVAIHQSVVDTRGVARDVPIPVNRLVYFCHDRRGADWTGRSLLRAAYKDFLLKESKLRLSAIGGERQSMGVPVVHYPRDAGAGARARALSIAREARAGEDSGIALEEGWTFSLVGVSGSTQDLLEWVKHHDEAIGRSVLAMFLNLGHDNGARSLGDTFVDFFLMALRRELRYIEEVVTEHVIRDFVRLNWGPDEPYPTLVAEDPRRESAPTADALSTLVTSGLITPDQMLRKHVRHVYGLPGEEPAANPVPPAEEPTAPGDEAPAGGGTADAGPVTGPLVPSGDDASNDDRTAASALVGVTYEQETERIRRKRDTREAQEPHDFRPAQWTHPNGHPRCAWCGIESRLRDGAKVTAASDPDDPDLLAPCPGSAHDGLTTSKVGSKGVAHPSEGQPQVFHMPGKHNQASHAKGGGSRKEIRERRQAEHDATLATLEQSVTPPTRMQRLAAENYANDDIAGQINGYLRTGDSSRIELLNRQWIPRMDSWIDAQKPTTKDVTLYRGVGPEVNVPRGRQVLDKGFTSMSADRGVAEGWAEGGTVMRITVPAGSKVGVMESALDVELLSEVVAPRGGRFDIGDADAEGIVNARYVS